MNKNIKRLTIDSVKPFSKKKINKKSANKFQRKYLTTHAMRDILQSR
nr:MAG TPA: hypothetical protein [Caudoviricetes sp.]